MDETTAPIKEDSFAKEVAKSAVISAAATAGSLVGLMVFAFALSKFSKKDKQQDETVVTPDAE